MILRLNRRDIAVLGLKCVCFWNAAIRMAMAWISVLGNDYFVSYNRVPWLRDARISSALNVRMAGHNAIEWPELDVDLEIDSLNPERYPLVMKRSPLDVL